MSLSFPLLLGLPQSGQQEVQHCRTSLGKILSLCRSHHNSDLLAISDHNSRFLVHRITEPENG